MASVHDRYGTPTADPREWFLGAGGAQAQAEAERLRRARASGEPCPFDGDLVHRLSLEDGYEIQRLTARSRMLEGARPVGYKVGLTSKVMQRQFGIDTPDRGIVFDDDVLPSGTELAAGAPGALKLEMEFALVVDADALADGLTPEAVTGAYLCFEILGTRYGSWRGTVAVSVADNAALHKVVLGSALPEWHPDVLAHTPATLLRNGEVVAQGSGADLDGGPWGSLRWLVDSISGTDPRLETGDLVLVGSMCGAVDVAAGDVFEARSAGGSSVTVAFA